jgi:hypothetical protein
MTGTWSVRSCARRSDYTEACAERLEALGKPVTLVIVRSGGHYDSMIRGGIPRGIAWLQELTGRAEMETTPTSR